MFTRDIAPYSVPLCVTDYLKMNLLTRFKQRLLFHINDIVKYSMIAQV